MSANDQSITHYQATWHVRSNSGNINLVMPAGNHEITGLNAEAFHALVDLLRNERPVYWNSTDQTIHTLSELVGEGEMK
jgi:hypothetical protein